MWNIQAPARTANTSTLQHTRALADFDISVVRSFEQYGVELSEADAELLKAADGGYLGIDRLAAAIEPNTYFPDTNRGTSRGPSLLDLAQVTNRGGDFWVHRLVYKNQPCNKASTCVFCASDTTPLVDPGFACGHTATPTVIMPFPIQICHTVEGGTFGDASELVNDTLAALNRSRSSAIARVLFSGYTDCGQRPGYLNGAGVFVPNPYVTMFASGGLLPAAANISPTTPVSPASAVARLSAALTRCNGTDRVGNILVTPETYESLVYTDYISDGRGLRTKLGHGISVDTGFDGRAPGATVPPLSTAASLDVYGIGQVSVLLGRPFINELRYPSNGRQDTVNVGGVTLPASSFDPKTNSITLTAVQQAAVTFDRCCWFNINTKAGVC